jgi:hypothetical protein
VQKNGDVHSNVWPTDLPYPPVDSSISRPGWGAGFEPQPLTKFYFAILGEKDKAKREVMHFDTVNWMAYWQLFDGLYQIPRASLLRAGSRVGPARRSTTPTSPATSSTWN